MGERFERAGRTVRVRYLVIEDAILCATLDTGRGDIAAIINERWGREAGLAHLLAHLDIGVPGAIICSPDCPG